jgi:hypothetical protein
LDNHAQIAAAVDASASTMPLTFTNSGTVVGDVKFGNVGANQLTISGANASLTGNISTLGNGRVAVSVSPSGAGGHLETASINTASTFIVGSGGTVTFDIGQNTSIVNASDAASLDANAHVVLKPVSLVPNGNIALIHSDTSLTINGNLSTIAAGATIPFLYTGTIGADSKNLTLTIARKSANELGLTGTAATIYEPAMTAAANDPTFAAALGTVPDAQHLQAALQQLQPADPSYVRAAAAFLTDPNSGPIGTRQRLLTLIPQDDGFAFWTAAGGDQLRFDGGDGHSFGATFGVDFNSVQKAGPKGHFGIAFTLDETHLKEAVNDAASRATWYLFTPYLGFEAGNFFVDAQLSGGSATVSTRRTVTVGTQNRISGGDTSEPLESFGMVGGYTLNYGGWRLAPEMSFSALQLMNASYTESGGGAGVDLSVHTKNPATMNAFAGVAASAGYEIFGGHLVPQLLAGWSESLDSERTKVTANFVSAPDASFSVTGPQSDRSGFLGAASVDFGNDYTTIGLGYDGTVGGKTKIQSAHVKVSSRF